jgi:hypothetical protein
VVVGGILDVDLQAGAELAGVLVEGRLEPAGRRRQPASQSGARACMRARIFAGAISGAPNSSSGRVVPRPSDSVVPSSITVPA